MGDAIGRLLSTPSSDGTFRAELWADAMIKILSCWIPIALATFVVGGNYLGPSLECFPMHLVSAVAAHNVNRSSAEAFMDPRIRGNMENTERTFNPQSLGTPSTDGTLRAELWADVMIKIFSCWVSIALATFVVAGSILGSSLECFPEHLASAVTTTAAGLNGSSAEAVRDPRMYSTQLDEFVNAYSTAKKGS
ncbi:Hypp8680 [Branchiostoma lanceolatum]|uniref:Hypp8680 protein n=1 Tax=Branchiostoma lanceolatum TaxID=7740 RepID=A0A8K0EFI7_BRALA|nr:Hypp8680 [Branchiostoma lanceolatum]